MKTDLPDWPRPYFREASGKPFVFYVAFGQLSDAMKVSASAYRFGGVPRGLELLQYGPGNHEEVVASFRTGYLWECLHAENLELAASVEQQTHCVVLRGDLEESGTLNDFRDVIGLLTYLVDYGCVAIYDPQMFKWWSSDDWRVNAFGCGGPSPRAHVTILFSEDEYSTEWIHTRGMRKFGRPDLSIHRVPTEHREGIIDLCNRFIEFQAFGGVIAEGQEVRMASLPRGMKCFSRGDYDDPDFNNVHIEITWPEAQLAVQGDVSAFGRAAP